LLRARRSERGKLAYYGISQDVIENKRGKKPARGYAAMFMKMSNLLHGCGYVYEKKAVHRPKAVLFKLYRYPAIVVPFAVARPSWP
jgi:negative regulator of replication initiation